jgi:hypothetical protein
MSSLSLSVGELDGQVLVDKLLYIKKKCFPVGKKVPAKDD